MKSVLFIICLSILLFSGCNKKEKLTVFDVRCESLNDPLRIDKTVPMFSWKIKSDKNGTEQKFYQVLVASEASLLDEIKAVLL